ncbi:Clustered mitochondria protein like [Dissostichus eleginoides]|uniref:Clustered mitochondria protein like n=1 Tax=Dissostichus eleginoides TaxID=100907 RepID=A0AAD9BCU6_DISEL|nr:Clustered mitochondria protein like [Dissostichus eleginoides]
MGGGRPDGSQASMQASTRFTVDPDDPDSVALNSYHSITHISPHKRKEQAGQMAAPRPAVPGKACELKVIPSRFEELPAPMRCGRGGAPGPRPTCLPGSETSGWGFVE